MNALRNGWFSELSPLWPGRSRNLDVEKVLYHEKSKYQDVLVFKSKTYGNVLVLDGAIQCTERDEFTYQEMITHLPLMSHPDPQTVLVIGGGDGGVLRELAKHSCIGSIVQCELDDKVIEVSKKYLPKMACGFDNPKLTLNIGDGFDFMKKNKGSFDIIITDSSDSIGPAEALFQRPYYKLMKEALRPGGIVCTQVDGFWADLDQLQDMQNFCSSLYPQVAQSHCTVPSYGHQGFVLCSTNPDTNFMDPVRKFTEEELEELNMKYYNTDVHRASFVLPQFAKKTWAPYTKASN